MSEINVAKFIFKKLSEVYKTTNEIAIYIKYLENALDFRLNFDSLTSGLKLDDNLTKLFYGNKDEFPQFFDYKKFADWSRLNNSIMPENECLAFYQKRNKTFVKIYDESVIDKLFNSAKNFNILKHIFILSKHEGDKEKIEYTTNVLSPFIYPAISESHLIGEKKLKGDRIAKLLNQFLEDQHEKTIQLEENWDFDYMTSDPSILDFIKKPILICSHIGCKINWKYKTNKIYNHFSPLALFNENINLEPIVICLTLDQNENLIVAYKPEEEICKQIKKQCIDAPGRISGANQYIKNVSSKSKYIKKQNDKKNIINKWWNAYPCRCDTCLLGIDNYSMNISTHGPQQRASIELDTLEYLQFFNLKNKENLLNLIKVYKLSIAALDIECYNKEISATKQNLSNLSYIGSKASVVSKQEMCLIDFGDHFFKTKPDHNIFRILEANDVQIVIDQLVDYIFLRHEIIVSEKINLMAPFYNFVEHYRNVHNKFWESEFLKKPRSQLDLVNKTIRDSFDNSLIGKFEQHLDHVKNMFYIYAHNGGKYDYVLLHRYIATCLKLKGFKKPFNTIKRESRFVKLSIPKTRICFVDSLDMIGVGCSLAKFAELTGQKETKMVFPFKCFTSPEFLKQTELPTKKSMWYNDLKQRYYTDEEIKTAHDAYKAVGARNIGEYLEAYLKSKYKNMSSN